jgi:hypothetical protein
MRKTSKRKMKTANARNTLSILTLLGEDSCA